MSGESAERAEKHGAEAERELVADALGVLLAHGAGDAVLCAGARNAPVIASLLALSRDGRIRTWRHFDERSAAFFALGLAKKTGAPAVVATTSGTAVAELLPAVVEAHYSGVPLLLLTADRPARFRGSGAPQAIEQEGIFGGYARFSECPREVLDWDRRGPLHLNLCLEEPGGDCGAVAPSELEAGVGGSVESWEAAGEVLGEPGPQLPDAWEWPDWERLPEGTVAVLGELPEELRDEVRGVLEALQLPTWCETTSGLRETGDFPKLTETALANRLVGAVLRFGGVPSLRFWRDLEAREEIPVWNFTTTGYSGLARPSRTRVIGPGWSEQVGKLAAVEGGGDDAAAMGETLPRNAEADLVRRLSEAIPPEALVFLGNSLPIREWNEYATRARPHPRCFANRGANGIDGELSTFLGLSRGEEESWGIFGDLTALCDLNAPWVLPALRSEDGGRRRIVVINNGGGRIFSRLPAMAGFSEEEKTVAENRHELSFEHWAAMWGIAYCRWTGEGDVPERSEDVLLIEVVVEA